MRWPFLIGGTLLLAGCNLDAGNEKRAGMTPMGPGRSVSAPTNAVPFAVPGPGTSSAEGAPPNIIRYPMPFLAQNEPAVADQTAALKFQTDNGASAEVEAICDVKEGPNAICWHPDGSLYPEFAERVRSRYKGPHPGDAPIPHSRNLKNRLVMAKIGVPGWNGIQLKSIGSNRNRATVSLELQRPRLEGEPVMYLSGGFASEPLSAKETSMRFTISLPLQDAPVIECKPGAKASFGGDIFTIKEIHQGHETAPQFSYGMESGDKWYVTFERSIVSSRDKMLLIVPIDSEGHRIAFLDEHDVPMSQESLGKTARGPHRYRPAEYNIMGRSPTEFTLVLNFNPAKVGRLRFEGFTSRLIDLTGIPLDPRK